MNKIKKLQITPSLSLTVVPCDKFKISYLAIYFSRSACESEAAKNALIPEILTRSCAKYPTMASLGEALQSLYGASVDPVNSFMGENHVFGMYSSFPENKYAFDSTDILASVCDIIDELINRPLIGANCAFDESIVESEKIKLMGRIKARINNPGAYALRRCEEIMCEGEKYAVSPSGTLESVEAVNAKELYDYYKQLPGKTEVKIYYSGSEDINRLAERFKKIFAAFDCPYCGSNETEIIRKCEKDVKTVIEEQSVSQGKLTVGLRTGYTLSDSDYHVFALFNSLLGSSPTSKLFMNVREKMSLCYYCSSRPNALKGIMTIASGIEVENFEKARDAIIEQINMIKSGDFSDFELESAKKSLINGYKELTDSPSGLVYWYFTRSYADRADSPVEVAEAVYKVTREEIITAANKLSLDTVYFLKGTLNSGEHDEENEENEENE